MASTTNHFTSFGDQPAVAAPGSALPLFTQRYVLEDISSDSYEMILEALPERRFRHTYYKGRLEMMSPSMFHDGLKSLSGRLIEAMALELNVPIKSIGSTTFHPEGSDRGLEGDEMYFVAHEPQMRGKDDYEYGVDPPPDLAVEVDIASSSALRFPVYAMLGVPEIWRNDGRSTEFLRLGNAGTYEPITHSISFPFLAPGDIDRILAQRREADENMLVREFLAWVRAQSNS